MAGAGLRAHCGRMIRLTVVLLAFAGAAMAQEQEPADDPELRPAPDYFVAAVVASTTAQQLAVSCDTLSLDPPKVQTLTANVLEKLDEDGFDISRADGGMLAPDDRFELLQQAFMLKHDLTGVITSEMVCAAGLAEIAEDTPIGRLLVELEQ